MNGKKEVGELRESERKRERQRQGEKLRKIESNITFRKAYGDMESIE